LRYIRIYIFLLICSLGLTNCSSKNDTIVQGTTTIGKERATSKNVYISPALIKWNNEQKIKLLPHQLAPTEYLEHNPNIKGLLLYHYLGTGKTYTALGFIQRNHDKPVVILAPRFLRSHWTQHIKEYGVTNSERITIITHDDPEKLLQINLKNTILVIDESHRIVERINSGISLDEQLYSNLYLHLKTAQRILSLSGTPIYGNLTDLAYQINLVSGKNDIPFNEAKFKETFLKINPSTSYLRGHMVESLFVPIASLTTSLGLALVFTSNPGLIIAAALGGASIPGLMQTLYPIQTTNLREFDTTPLKHSVEKYVSFYDFNSPDKTYFPTSTVYIQNVSYNKPQIDFLFNFEDSRLNIADVKTLLKDERTPISDDLIYLNSTNIQNSLNKKPGAGQQIANLSFSDPKDPTRTLHPNKFKNILKLMNTKPGPAVLYSKYYHNGILLFADFLDKNGKKGKYAILHPDMSVEEHANVISKYNNGLLEILLIHPEITEGISLKGARQMHLLETPYNRAFQEQMIGRVVRYKSHMHLPVKDRHVDVYIWKAAMPKFGLENNIALRENWDNYFSELNYYSNFGQNRIQIDPNAQKKNISPDDLAYVQLENLNANMNKLKAYLEKYSIENADERDHK
jgi:hypothetical protein